MNSTAFAGFNGQVEVSTDGGNTYISIGKVRDATLTINQDEIDATTYDTPGWAENIVGFKSWEMSIESLLVSTDGGDLGQTTVFNSLIAGEVITFRFSPLFKNDKAAYKGEGFVTSFEVNVPVDDVVSLSLEIMGTAMLQPEVLKNL